MVFFSFGYLLLAVATLLCLSTIYCRYHYVIDVLSGLLTATVVIPIGNWLYWRFAPKAGSSPAKPPPTSRLRN